MADLSVIPGRELQLAGPESITHVPAKAGNRFRIMDSGLAARAAPRNDRSIGVWTSAMQWRAPRVTRGSPLSALDVRATASPLGGPSGLGGGELTSNSAALVSRSIHSYKR